MVSGEVCGPVTIQIEGFEPVSSEVTFVDMELEGGRYRPLLGYTVLEQAGLAADPVGGRPEDPAHGPEGRERVSRLRLRQTAPRASVRTG